MWLCVLVGVGVAGWYDGVGVVVWVGLTADEGTGLTTT